MAKKHNNPKAPVHRTIVQTVWTLLRVTPAERAVIGQFSSSHKGVQEVQRIVAKDCGLKVIPHMPPWTTVDDGLEFVHGRDHLSWWFRLEPWPLDGESA